MARLDLHGIRHIEVENIVEDFIFNNTVPMYIITGNSEGMKKIVFKVLDKHNFKYLVWTDNLGQIVVTE